MALDKRRFVEARLQGKTLEESARAAGSKAKSVVARATQAQRMLKNAEVQGMITKRAEAVLARERINSDTCLEALAAAVRGEKPLYEDEEFSEEQSGVSRRIKRRWSPALAAAKILGFVQPAQQTNVRTYNLFSGMTKEQAKEAYGRMLEKE